MGFSFDDEPTVNSQDELAVATNGSSMGSADLFSKVCGLSHRPRPRAADLQDRSALRLLLAQLRMPALRRLPDNPVVLGVRSDPEPVDSLLDVSPQCPVMIADADGPKMA